MAGRQRAINFYGIDFVVDSGADVHIITDDDLFSDYVELANPIPIQIARNETFIYGYKRGIVKITSSLGAQGVFTDVLYCPEAPYNLLSVDKLHDAGLEVRFNADRTIEILKNGKIILYCNRNSNSQSAKLKINRPSANSCNSKCSYNLWHKRLEHRSRDKFVELKKHNMVHDVSLLQKIQINDNLCEACTNAKIHRLDRRKPKNKTDIDRPLQIIHSDICGPITPLAISGHRYSMLFIDQFTHYCVTYLATHKSDLPTNFKDYTNKSEANFNSKMVHLYIDNGTEYLSNEMKNFCMEKGITFHTTIPHTPHQNGVSERMIQTITEKARSLLCESKLPQQFWGEAVLAATFLTNITPSRALKGRKTPFELWHNKKPILKYLKIFGSTVWVHNKAELNKFDNKSIKGILVGFVPNGYKVFNAESNTFFTARDIIVDEVSFKSSRPKLSLPDTDNSDNSSDWLPKSNLKTPEVESKETKENTSERESEDEIQKNKKMTSAVEAEGESKEKGQITSENKPEGELENIEITSDEEISEGEITTIIENTPKQKTVGGETSKDKQNTLQLKITGGESSKINKNTPDQRAIGGESNKTFKRTSESEVGK